MSDQSTPNGPPLGVGGLVGEGFGLILRNFLQFALIWLIPIVIFTVFQLLIFGAFFQQLTMMSVNPEAALAAGIGQFIGMFVLFLVLVIVISSFAYAATVQAAYDARAGRPVRLGVAISTGFARVLPLSIVSLVVGIGLYLAMIIVAMLIGFVLGQLGAAGSVLGFIIILVGVLYVAAALCVMVPSLVVENSWFASIGRSLSLTNGYRWPLVGMMLLVFLVMFVMFLVFAGVQFILLNLGIVGAILIFVLSLAIAPLTYGYSIVVFSLAYARLREIKEGTGMEELANVFS